jgi:hypothetical protein
MATIKYSPEHSVTTHRMIKWSQSVVLRAQASKISDVLISYYSFGIYGSYRYAGHLP